jgi:hypothetical protein
LSRLTQIALQPGLLSLRITAVVVVVQLAVEGDEVGVAPVEGVVAPRALGSLRGKWKFSRYGAPFFVSTSWLPRDGKTGTLSTIRRYGAKNFGS